MAKKSRYGIPTVSNAWGACLPQAPAAYSSAAELMPPACDKPLDRLAPAAANTYQLDMPLCAPPYLAMGQQLGCTEPELLDCLQNLKQRGVLSRIGPVFNHQQAGASTLAALSVPSCDVEAVAAHINRYPEVNHNYLRSHRRNLWFVITAADRARI